MIKGIGLPIEDDGVLLDVLERAKVLGMKQGPSTRGDQNKELKADFYFDYDDPSGAEIYTGEEDVSPSILYILNPKMQNDSEIKRLVDDLDQMLDDEDGVTSTSKKPPVTKATKPEDYPFRFTITKTMENAYVEVPAGTWEFTGQITAPDLLASGYRLQGTYKCVSDPNKFAQGVTPEDLEAFKAKNPNNIKIQYKKTKIN